VGKVVFANASRIGTFFGLTRRKNDRSAILMGEAGLTIHAIEGKVYDWYGYYANHEPGEKRGSRVLPIQGSVAASFAETFRLTRSSPGLSIVVPYLRGDVKLNELACAVIEQYFLLILAGRLQVTLQDSSRKIVISQPTINQVASQLAWRESRVISKSEIAAILGIGQWQVALRPSDYLALSAVGRDEVYDTPIEELFPAAALTRIVGELYHNERIAVEIPVRVGSTEEERVRVVLERDQSLRANNVPHFRSGINISKMRTRRTPKASGAW
jgi:hypothetical protein